ncbi:MAG: ABC transporter permease [Puniceicoccales bacterium]|jgi:microcin C transport system permease protein|nr:ABC transporter permease [Puniceicoccales bacterium]
MRQYFLRRLLLLPLTLLGITFVAFVITRFVPGGPLDQALAEKQQAARGRGLGGGSGSTLSPAEELQLKRFYKLDRPLLAGYAEWLGVQPGPAEQQIVNITPGRADGGTEVLLEISSPRNGGRAPKLRIPATVRIEGEAVRVLTQESKVAAAARDLAQRLGLGGAEERALCERASRPWFGRLLVPEANGGAGKPAAGAAVPAPVQVDIFQKRFDGILQGQFGTSFLRGAPVLDVILSKLPVSAWFGAWSLVLTYGVCVPLGIVKALRHRARVDNATSVLLFTAYAIPGYILAVVFQYAFAFNLHWLPHSGFTGLGAAGGEVAWWEFLADRFRHTVLPLASLTAGGFALMTMLMKNTLLDNLALDYVRTAVAKGVSHRDAILGHALRNSLVPVATSLGGSLSALLTGSFLIEKIFDIDGIGLLGFSSLVGRDYPVFLGLLTLSSLLLLLGNILGDIAVAFADPRIRFGG